MDNLEKFLVSNQVNKLKKEVDDETFNQSLNTDLEKFLLTAPTFTNKQLDEITITRKTINEWRKKFKIV
jgi:hypothetical protein